MIAAVVRLRMLDTTKDAVSAQDTQLLQRPRERMRQRVIFFQAFYNIARSYLSLRQPLPLHEC
jgi:hypothetical protein